MSALVKLKARVLDGEYLVEHHLAHSSLILGAWLRNLGLIWYFDRYMKRLFLGI